MKLHIELDTKEQTTRADMIHVGKWFMAMAGIDVAPVIPENYADAGIDVAAAFAANPLPVTHAAVVTPPVPGAARGLLPENKPAADVPPPPAGAGAAAGAGVELDATGLPWDERIHSGNKTKSEKGAWRLKKGVSKEQAAAVEAQLRAGQPASANVPPPPPANPGAAAANVPPPPAASANVPPPPPAAGAAATPDAFGRLQNALAMGIVTATEVIDQCKLYGHESLATAQAVPAIMGAIVNGLVAAGKAI